MSEKKFQFRQYHYRAMNAKSEEEKQAINQELKDLYDSLGEDEKRLFNEELQSFLVTEYSKLKSMSEGLKDEEE